MMRSAIAKRLLLPILLVGLVAAGSISLIGCDSVSSENDRARVRLLLTDAPFPFDLVDEARVTISSVELVRLEGDAEGEVVIISDDVQQYNLLDLRDGVTAVLGERTVEPGEFTHARLTVDDAVVIMNDGTEYDLKVPSSKIKVFLPDFVATEGDVAEAVLDFDVSKSFVVRGNIERPGFKGFIFKPVVRPIFISTGEGDQDFDDDFDDDDPEIFTVTGAVEAFSDTSVTVQGLEFHVTSETEFEDIADLAALLVGDTVQIRYRIEEDGTLTITRIERGDDDDVENEFEAEGDIQAISGNTITVNGLEFQITSTTVFEGAADLTDFQVGDRVEIRYRVAENGDLEVTNIERED